MPDGTNFQIAAYTCRKNEEYLIHVIALLHVIEQKEMASDIKKAWEAIAKVRRELKPYFEFPEDETKAAKEI
jgi:hypothetical protein